tara:strand:- start:349 stop:1407 length:1059 start_codon:yes stop_codon:yes gene_type:complete
MVCGKGELGVRGVVYDMEAWARVHPGGEVFLRAVEGMDATALFESSHVHIAVAEAMLSMLPVKGCYTMPVKYKYEMYSVLREKVLEKLPTRRSRRMPWEARLRMWCWLVATGVSHTMLMMTGVGSGMWGLVCVVCALCNSVMGGYGHNAVHRLEWHAVFLDWNGLSSFEWLFEHVVSHHPHVNTDMDHDAISMEPFLRWLPHRPAAALGDAQRGSVATHLIYAFGEAVVALQGCFGHRLRWHAKQYRAPVWMERAPWLFVARAASLLLARGVAAGGISFLCTLCLASYYFSYMAHRSHSHVDTESDDFARVQLQNTKDIPARVPEVSLFLDRQKLHHLFPTVDHTLLTSVFG